MRLIRTDERLVVRDQRGARYAVGLFFALIGGTFVYGGLGGFTNHDEVGLFANFAAVGIGAAGVIAGLAFGAATPGVTLILDRATRQFTLRISIWGKTVERSIMPGDLSAIDVVKTPDGDGGHVHSMALIFRDGTGVPIGAGEHTPQEDVEAIVDALRSEGGLPRLPAGPRR